MVDTATYHPAIELDLWTSRELVPVAMLASRVDYIRHRIGSTCAVVVLPDQGEIRCFLSSCSGCCSDLIQVFDNEFRQIFDRPQGHNVRPYSCTYQDGATQRVVTQARLLGPSHTLQIYSNAANKLCAAEYTLHAV